MSVTIVSRLAALLLLGVLCEQCSSIGPRADQPTPPANYKKLIAEKGRGLFAKEYFVALEAQISALRVNNTAYVADWNACLKVDVNGKPEMYAVFINNDAVVHIRLALKTDGCDSEALSPLTFMTAMPPAAGAPNQPCTPRRPLRPGSGSRSQAMGSPPSGLCP